VLMQFESDHNHTSKALELCQRSLDYYKKSEDPDRIADSMRHVADLHRRLGNSDDSERCYREAIGIYRRNADTNLGDLVNALRGFGLLLNKQVNKKEAIAVWREVKQLYFECHLHEGVEEATKNLEALE
ncbi:MAG: tetratricopeptide repeat protein, partial [Saprospiraceae bacterium]|nr:tetratricopeptide repeat protein [Saprospiraceae bacterium]